MMELDASIIILGSFYPTCYEPLIVYFFHSVINLCIAGIVGIFILLITTSDIYSAGLNRYWEMNLSE